MYDCCGGCIHCSAVAGGGVVVGMRLSSRLLVIWTCCLLSTAPGVVLADTVGPPALGKHEHGNQHSSCYSTPVGERSIAISLSVSVSPNHLLAIVASDRP